MALSVSLCSHRTSSHPTQSLPKHSRHHQHNHHHHLIHTISVHSFMPCPHHNNQLFPWAHSETQTRRSAKATLPPSRAAATSHSTIQPDKHTPQQDIQHTSNGPPPQASKQPLGMADVQRVLYGDIRVTKAIRMMWSLAVQPGDIVVDATLGNGHDTLALSQLVGPTGVVYGFDVQQSAVDATQGRLNRELSPEHLPNVHLMKRCHSEMQQVVGSGVASVVVFNLGYLPGSDKQVTTTVGTTLEAVEAALEVVKIGGMISLLLYRGHDEGVKEESAVRAWAAQLPPNDWVCYEVRLLNRPLAPVMLTITRRP